MLIDQAGLPKAAYGYTAYGYTAYGEDGTSTMNAKSPAFAGLSVRPGRLELPPRLRRTRPSTLRVYQFRHRRVER